MENERERDVMAGRNAVTEALKAGRPIDSILVRRGEKNGIVHSPHGKAGGHPGKGSGFP